MRERVATKSVAGVVLDAETVVATKSATGVVFDARTGVYDRGRYCNAGAGPGASHRSAAATHSATPKLVGTHKGDLRMITGITKVSK